MIDPHLFDDIEKFLETGEQPWPMEAPVSKEEWMTLVESAYTANNGPITEEQAIGLLRWAENVRVGVSVLDLVLNGMILVVPDENDPMNPAFRISEYGKRVVDAGTQIS